MHRADSHTTSESRPVRAVIRVRSGRATARRALTTAFPRWPLLTALTLGALAAGCSNDDHPVAPIGVHVTDFTVGAVPSNVLAAVARFDARGADSAAVVYWSDSEPPRATPFSTTLTPDSTVVLGLRPSTAYHLRVDAIAGGTVISSDTITFGTGALPDFLANSHLRGSVRASGGYILTALSDTASAYVVAFDSTGEVRWYHGFDEGVPVGEVKQQANGDITAFLGATHGGDPVPGRYVELSPGGDVVREIGAPPGAYVDNHELVLVFNDGQYDGAYLSTYTQRQVDLSSQGGPSDSLVSGHQIVRANADGSTHTILDAWDTFTLADNVEPIEGEVDFDHPNSIDVASDGNLVVSWRNFDAITKIDVNSGAIIWRLGGPHSDFTFVGDPLGGFSAQHSARVVGDNDILVFDNGTQHSPPESRAVEYTLDPTAKTATMKWEYRHVPPVYTTFTGSVQRLASGNTLIGWTWPPTLLVTEVTPGGTVAWEGTLEAPSLFSPYRFTAIRSLYGYEQP
ncbi:MAG TPA: aryl-sulfate sulfotransferase [Gemmatimonadaceae bacterium]